MKKFLSVFLCLIMCVTLSGCAGNDSTVVSVLEEESSVIITAAAESNNSADAVSDISSKQADNKPAGNSSKNAPVKENNDNNSQAISEPAVSEPPVVFDDDVEIVKQDLANIEIKDLTPDAQKTEEDILKLIGDYTAAHDGVHMSNSKTAKDTDTVTMQNLYIGQGLDKVIAEYKQVDSLVLEAIKSNSKENIKTGMEYTDDNMNYMQNYANAFYNARGFVFSMGYSGIEGGFMEIFIDMEETFQNKSRYESNIADNPDDLKYINDAIKKCSITKGMLQKDAIVKINEYICSKVEYDYDTHAFSLSEFFVNGKAICNSYAQVFELMCRTVGIDAKFIGGTADNKSHAWNSVTFSDGSVYYFDTCWNDSYINYNGTDYQKFDRFMFAEKIDGRTQSYTMVVGYNTKFK